MMQVLLTRPEAQSRAFAEALRAEFGAGLEVIESPLLRIKFLTPEVDFAGFDAVIFTSQNGVRAYAHLGGPAGMPAYCVGARTAEAARALGLEAHSADGDVAALDDLVRGQAKGARLLHLSGAHVAGAIAGPVTRVIAYEQRTEPFTAQALAALNTPKEIAVPLFSPRTAALFASGFPNDARATLHLMCLSPAVAAALKPRQFAAVRVCNEPTARAMMAQLSELVAPRST